MHKQVAPAEGLPTPRQRSPAERCTPEVDALTLSAEHALKALVEYQVETLRFVGRRTYRDMEFLRQLRHCTGWPEAAQLRQSWLKECIADYGEEWGRIAATSFQLATNGFAPLQSLIHPVCALRPLQRRRLSIR